MNNSFCVGGFLNCDNMAQSNVVFELENLTKRLELVVNRSPGDQ